MKRFLLFAILLSSFFVSVPAAHAIVINFDFNSLADGNANYKVQNYMNNILTALHPGGSVTVTGSKAEKDYTGDGHAVGPVAGSTVTALTLGNTDAGVQHATPYDAYLVNSGSDRITMFFSFPIYAVSFDYEIFPDGTCPVAGACSAANWPDFTFDADGVIKFHTTGIDPNTTGPYQHSPNSGISKNEKAPQFLGLSGNYLFPSGVTKLEFIDWPRMIGIDNLKIQDQKPVAAVPEPSSIFLVATGLLGFTGIKRKRV